MQSTGHSSTHDLSMMSMHGPAMTYGMVSLLPLESVGTVEVVLRSGRHGLRGRAVGGVPGEQLGGGVEVHCGVVDRGGHLAEPYGDQSDLAVVVGDVSGGEDARDVGAHPRVDDQMPVVVQLHAPVAQRAEVGGEAECCDELLAGEPAWLALACHGDLDALELVTAASRHYLGVRDDLGARGPELLDGPMMGTEGFATMDEGEAARDRLEHQRPVHRAVTAADDDDVLAGILRRRGHEVLQTLAEEVLSGRQRSRSERADAAGDDDRSGRDLDAGTGLDDKQVWLAVAGNPVQLLRLLAEQIEGVVRCGLLGEVADQLTPRDRREAGDVEDLLLGVHRADLATDLAQRIDHGHREPTDAGVVGAEQPDRARAHYQQVDSDRAHE